LGFEAVRSDTLLVFRRNCLSAFL